MSRESRAYLTGIGGYELSFNLIHTAPKIWFAPLQDILYFNVPPRPRDSRRGSRELEAFRNFSNTLSLVDAKQLRKVRKLAVEVALFGTLRRRWGYGREHEDDPLLVQFWEYVTTKLLGLEEIIFIIPDDGGDDTARAPYLRVFLPVEWLREKELQGKVEDLSRRIKLALRSMQIEDGAVRNKSRTLPKWKVVVLEEDVGLES